MNAILSNNYYVNFQQDAYDKLNEFLTENSPSKIFVLVDENTSKHCIPILLDKLKTSLPLEVLQIPAGEQYKNMETCVGLWDALTEMGADRKSLLINLGGGVVTDMGGFVASAFKRGIAFINIPTTLLSMVDASVGGKTGVDLGVLKNQIGFFADPEMVLIDPLYLNTLALRELRSGLAEIIKYGFTHDPELWEEICQISNIDATAVSTLIHRSIIIKNEVVTEDPKESGLRKVLNFGHTMGHAIESYHLEAPDKEKITHGEAIAAGMVAALFISREVLNFPDKTLSNFKKKIHEMYGKLNLNQYDYDAILDLLVHDKKNVSGEVRFVLLSDLKEFKLDCVVDAELLKSSLDYYCN